MTDIPSSDFAVVASAAIAALSTVAVAYINRTGNRKTEKIKALESTLEENKQEIQQLQSELYTKSKVLSLARYTGQWSAIEQEVFELIEETEIDRFLILAAWNGCRDPRWVTATTQIRATGQKPVPYIHVDLDDHYVHLMLNCKDTKNPVVVNVDKLEPCLIKDIYLAEGINHSLWFHLASYDNANGCREVNFCSFSTKGKKEISLATKVRCQLISDRLRMIALHDPQDLPRYEGGTVTV